MTVANRLLTLGNSTASHALCWADGYFRRVAGDAFASVVAVARGAESTGGQA